MTLQDIETQIAQIQASLASLTTSGNEALTHANFAVNWSNGAIQLANSATTEANAAMTQANAAFDRANQRLAAQGKPQQGRTGTTTTTTTTTHLPRYLGWYLRVDYNDGTLDSVSGPYSTQDQAKQIQGYYLNQENVDSVAGPVYWYQDRIPQPNDIGS